MNKLNEYKWEEYSLKKLYEFLTIFLWSIDFAYPRWISTAVSFRFRCPSGGGSPKARADTASPGVSSEMILAVLILGILGMIPFNMD